MISNEELFDNEENMHLGKEPMEGYTLIEWPEVQYYMDEDWFDDEAFLDMSEQYGDCAYWIPDEYIKKVTAVEK